MKAQSRCDIALRGILATSGGNFVQRSVMILSILVEGHLRDICVKLYLKLVHWSRRRCRLKVILFFGLAAISFSEAERF